MSAPRQADCRNRLLAMLAPEDFSILPLERVSFALKDTLIQPNRPVDHAWFIERGLASLTINTGGKRVEVGMIGREGVVGASPLLLGTDRTPLECFIQMPGEAYRIGAADLLACCDASPGLRTILLRSVQALTLQAAETAQANAVHTLSVRLARWLLLCRDRAEDDDMVVTHEIMSIMLGVRRPGITVATQVLEGHRLIRARRGRVTVLDRPGLEALAGSSYGMAEAEYEALLRLPALPTPRP
jgi:CRP-like cAMP-binding protein